MSEKGCTAEGCSNKAISRGMCRRHYQASYRAGMEKVGTGRPKSTEEDGERFVAASPATRKDIHDLSMAQMREILMDPKTPKEMRISIFRVAARWDIESEDPAQKEELDELRGQVIGIDRGGIDRAG